MQPQVNVANPTVKCLASPLFIRLEHRHCGTLATDAGAWRSSETSPVWRLDIDVVPRWNSRQRCQVDDPKRASYRVCTSTREPRLRAATFSAGSEKAS